MHSDLPLNPGVTLGKKRRNKKIKEKGFSEFIFGKRII
jgi:hypothetical protein